MLKCEGAHKSWSVLVWINPAVLPSTLLFLKVVHVHLGIAYWEKMARGKEENSGRA